MSTVYLNDRFLPLAEARISPMDRGFLFGDGIYEVIPSYNGRLIGFEPHIARLRNGLNAIGIELERDTAFWREICDDLIRQNGSGNLGIYLQVSRGADNKRFHAYPEDVTPTIFGFTFEIPAEPVADRTQAKPYRVVTTEDLRWQRCHIKSTALLGNVMHFQTGFANGKQETLLYNRQGELTEGSASNVFIVKDQCILTPPLDNQILPGITRLILIDTLRKTGRLPIKEQKIRMNDVHHADEIWLTSSTKEIAPVVEIDDKPVGNGEIGAVWELAQSLFSEHKYGY